MRGFRSPAESWRTPVAVGGAREGNRGDAWIAGRFPDVVSEYVHAELALAGTLSEYGPAAGTSLATPTAAGAVAESLWMVRDSLGATTTGVGPGGAVVAAEGAFGDGALTAAELRDAMKRSAVLWDVRDWSPPALADVGDGPLTAARHAGAPVLAAAPQIGWGYVGADVSPLLAEHLLGAELPEKPPEVEAFMAANMETRRAAWGER